MNDSYIINLTHNYSLHSWVFNHLSGHASIAPANHQNLSIKTDQSEYQEDRKEQGTADAKMILPYLNIL